MAITAADIHNQSFSIDRKGYDVDEVDVFLEHVADEIDGLNSQIASLESQLEKSASTEAASAEASSSSQEDNEDISALNDLIAEKEDTIADLERQLEEKKANDSAISAALIIAQRSADDIIAKANMQASDTIQDARDEATRILNRANSDKQDVLDSIRKLEDDRDDTREEYADVLKDFITDASRKLADLGVAVDDFGFSSASGLEGQQTGDFLSDDYEAQAVAADYTTPQTTDTIVAAATPVASAYEKDLSGFGDADEFGFEDID